MAAMLCEGVCRLGANPRAFELARKLIALEPWPVDVRDAIETVLLLPVVLFACPVVASGRADWQRILPAGENRCSNGSPSPSSCGGRTPASPAVPGWWWGLLERRHLSHPAHVRCRGRGNFDPAGMGGVLDLSRRENPFARHTVVVAPVLHRGSPPGQTGPDLLGAGQQRHGARGPGPPSREVNAASVLDWMSSNLGRPAQIVVVRTSAGSVPTPFYGELLSRRFSTARVVAIGDGAGIHHFKGAGFRSATGDFPVQCRRILAGRFSG